MDDETRRPSYTGSVRVADEDRLAELGYKQELTRNWSLLHNFGVSFSIIVSQYRIRILAIDHQGRQSGRWKAKSFGKKINQVSLLHQ